MLERTPFRQVRCHLGRPEAAFVIERIVDLAADELGIDPAELRRRNMIPPEKLQEITEELGKKGYDGHSLDKILGGNWMRVMRQVWK